MASRSSDAETTGSTGLLYGAFGSWDPTRWSSARATEALALGIAGLRSGLFVAESLPLAWLQRLGAEQKTSPPPPEALAASLDRLRRLLEEDARQIARGSYPLSVLTPRDPLGHGWRLMRILTDAAGVARRRRRREVRAFGREARQWLADMPDYYRRNFHHQTDGYLSERSADLYDHQVELLFRGGADAMRRLILPPLKSHLGSRDGRGMHLLELGAGCGTATRSVARAFPAAKITCVDISYPYIKRARKELDGHHRIDFVQGDAAALDFRQDRFDAVYSVFLLHELPPDVRVRVLEEALRVVKPGGFLGLVDSIQKGDDEDLDWALDFFPRHFHEPYYASYAAHPMETLMKEAGVESLESTTGYLSKVVWGVAPANPRPPSRERQEG